MSGKVTLWLFKALFYSHLAALYRGPFPAWLPSPVNREERQPPPYPQPRRAHLWEAVADGGTLGALLGKEDPAPGHTSVAGSWVDKAMCIWDEEGIGVPVLSAMPPEKHLVLRQAAVRWPWAACRVTWVMPVQMQTQLL